MSSEPPASPRRRPPASPRRSPRSSPAIDRGTPVVYAPPMWGPVMAVIKRLPFVMRRVGF